MNLPRGSSSLFKNVNGIPTSRKDKSPDPKCAVCGSKIDLEHKPSCPVCHSEKLIINIICQDCKLRRRLSKPHLKQPKVLYRFCEHCKKLFSRKSNSQKLCPECRKIVYREQGRIRVSLWREKQRNLKELDNANKED